MHSHEEMTEIHSETLLLYKLC